MEEERQRIREMEEANERALKELADMEEKRRKAEERKRR